MNPRKLYYYIAQNQPVGITRLCDVLFGGSQGRADAALATLETAGLLVSEGPEGLRTCEGGIVRPTYKEWPMRGRMVRSEG